MEKINTVDALSPLVFDGSRIEQGDFYNDDGLICCRKCGTPKQMRVNILDEERVVVCICKCESERLEAEKQEREREKFRTRCMRNRNIGFPDEKMQHWTFANDDRGNPALTQAMRNYVDHFAEMRREGKGLLLYGDVGTGKTYAACEVANALIDAGYMALVTSVQRITNTMQGMYEGRQEYIDSLNRYSLLVIDDLAAERDTEYMQEQVYNIIDARYRAGLPMIITTNLSGHDLKNPESMSKARIYSRLLERCHPIEVKGQDRRKAALKREYGSMRELLGI